MLLSDLDDDALCSVLRCVAPVQAIATLGALGRLDVVAHLWNGTPRRYRVRHWMREAFSCRPLFVLWRPEALAAGPLVKSLKSGTDLRSHFRVGRSDAHPAAAKAFDWTAPHIVPKEKLWLKLQRAEPWDVEEATRRFVRMLPLFERIDRMHQEGNLWLHDPNAPVDEDLVQACRERFRQGGVTFFDPSFPDTPYSRALLGLEPLERPQWTASTVTKWLWASDQAVALRCVSTSRSDALDRMAEYNFNGSGLDVFAMRRVPHPPPEEVLRQLTPANRWLYAACMGVGELPECSEFPDSTTTLILHRLSTQLLRSDSASDWESCAEVLAVEHARSSIVWNSKPDSRVCEVMCRRVPNLMFTLSWDFVLTDAAVPIRFTTACQALELLTERPKLLLSLAELHGWGALVQAMGALPERPVDEFNPASKPCAHLEGMPVTVDWLVRRGVPPEVVPGDLPLGGISGTALASGSWHRFQQHRVDPPIDLRMMSTRASVQRLVAERSDLLVELGRSVGWRAVYERVETLREGWCDHDSHWLLCPEMRGGDFFERADLPDAHRVRCERRLEAFVKAVPEVTLEWFYTALKLCNCVPPIPEARPEFVRQLDPNHSAQLSPEWVTFMASLFAQRAFDRGRAPPPNQENNWTKCFLAE